MNVKLSLMSIAIYGNPDQTWLSMKKIIPSLNSSYLEHLSGVESQFINDLSQVGLEKYATFVCLDGNLEKISLVCKRITFDQLIIHIHGDFMEHISGWLDFFKSYSHFNIKLVCSTTAQKNLLKNVMSYESFVFPPFQLCNKRMSLPKKDSYKFIYFGRISENKNIDWLIQYFDKFQLLTKRSDELIIRGPVDDIKCMVKDLYRISMNLDDYLVRLCTDVQSKVNIQFGEFKITELDGADFFISLSTYHDEDYGLAAFEAIDRDLIPVLTNWGGYKSFNKACGLKGINIKLTPKGASLDMMSFMSQMLTLVEGVEVEVSPLEKDSLNTIISSQRFLSKENFEIIQRMEDFKGNTEFSEEFNKEGCLTYFSLYDGSYC